MTRQGRDKCLQPRHRRQLRIVPQDYGIPFGGNQGGGGLELLLDQSLTEQVVALQIGRPLEFRQHRKMRRGIPHRSA